MASEFEGLEGISFVDEGQVRREVAAQLNSAGGAEAKADRDKIAVLSAALANEEATISSLREREPLAVADRAILNQATATANRLVKAIAAAEKDAAARAECRRQVELARLTAEAQREARRLAVQQEQFRRDNEAADALVAAGGARTAYARAGHLPAPSNLVMDDPFADPLPTSASAAATANNNAGGGGTANSLRTFIRQPLTSQAMMRAKAMGHAAVTAARAIQPLGASQQQQSTSSTKRRVGTNATAAIEAYTGGDLLPSANSVTATRAELKAFKAHGRVCRPAPVKDEEDEYQFDHEAATVKAEAGGGGSDSDSSLEILDGPTQRLSGGTNASRGLSGPVNGRGGAGAAAGRGGRGAGRGGGRAPSPPAGPWTPMAAPPEHLDDGSEMLFQQRLERLAVKKEAHRQKRTRERAIAVKSEPGTAEADDERRAEPRGPADEGDDDDDEDDVYVELFHGQQIYLQQHVFDALLDYQQKGVQWLLQHHLKGEGCILGDEMGLGKTVQIAAMLNALHTSQRLIGPVLIACPLTVMNQWVSELHRWAPELRVAKFHSSSSNDGPRDKVLSEAHRRPAVVVTTYQSMAMNVETLLKVQFQYVILDEGHKICNPNSAATIAAKTFATPHRILMTGSPIQNTLKELWCLFDFCRKGLLGTQSRFVEEFERPISHSRNPKATPLEQATAVQCAVALREHIAPYLLRRLKKDVNARLPAKHERVIRCSLTDSQLDMYVNFLMTKEVQSLLQSCSDNRLHKVFKDGGAGFLADGTFVSKSGKNGGLADKDYYRAYHILSQLRLLCSHADIFRLKLEDTAEGGSGKNISFRSNNPVDYSGSCKLDALRRLMVQWKANGHKVLIFSQWVMALDIIENCVEQEGHRYVRVDGKTPADHRSVLLDKFNEDPTIFCALLTTRVGGLGLNLTGADRVVLFDPDWNPKVDEQARERAWRIGQKREVCVYRMITSGTIEEHILHRQLAKSYVTDKVLENPQLQQVFAVMSLVEGFYLSSHYADRIASNVRHLVCSMQMDLLADEDDAEVAREVARDNSNANAAVGAGAVASPTMNVKTEGGVKREPGVGGGGGGVKAEPGTAGTHVKTEGGVKREFPSSSAAAATAHRSTAAAVSSAPAPAEERHETSILSDILDGSSARIGRFSANPNGGDMVTSRLASMAAANIMRRVAESGAGSALPQYGSAPQQQRGGDGASRGRGRGMW